MFIDRTFQLERYNLLLLLLLLLFKTTHSHLPKIFSYHPSLSFLTYSQRILFPELS
jgi:hypothetical protein